MVQIHLPEPTTHAVESAALIFRVALNIFGSGILTLLLVVVNEYFQQCLENIHRAFYGDLNMADAKHGLGEYVKRVMKLKGLTQKDVQRMSGDRITDGYVASITTGRASNLSVDKLIALADGLGVDSDELFHVACGQQPDVRARSGNRPDSMMILETVQKAVMSPAVTQILDEVVRLSPDQRAGLLAFINRMGSVKRKSRRKSKPD